MARVLLAEKDERIRRFIAGILIDFGHDVSACADWGEASARLGREAVDVVLTDLVLCCPRDARRGKNWAALGIPTITLSGRELHAGDAAQQLPVPLVDKPFRFADLQCVLDALAHCRERSQGRVRTAA